MVDDGSSDDGAGIARNAPRRSDRPSASPTAASRWHAITDSASSPVVPWRSSIRTTCGTRRISSARRHGSRSGPDDRDRVRPRDPVHGRRGAGATAGDGRARRRLGADRRSSARGRSTISSTPRTSPAPAREQSHDVHALLSGPVAVTTSFIADPAGAAARRRIRAARPRHGRLLAARQRRTRPAHHPDRPADRLLPRACPGHVADDTPRAAVPVLRRRPATRRRDREPAPTGSPPTRPEVCTSTCCSNCCDRRSTRRPRYRHAVGWARPDPVAAAWPAFERGRGLGSLLDCPGCGTCPWRCVAGR